MFIHYQLGVCDEFDSGSFLLPGSIFVQILTVAQSSILLVISRYTPCTSIPGAYDEKFRHVTFSNYNKIKT